MSLGGGKNTALNTAVKALVASGVSTIVAAGNSNRDACSYSPASEPDAITVGATTKSDKRASFSNYGQCVDIFAPGSSITAPWIGSNTALRTISGTSMASPHVCGAAALYLGQDSNLSPNDILQKMLDDSIDGTITNVGSGSPNKFLYVAADQGQECDITERYAIKRLSKSIGCLPVVVRGKETMFYLPSESSSLEKPNLKGEGNFTHHELRANKCGGHLASILNKDELDLVISLLPTSHQVWLGGSSISTCTNEDFKECWEWSDGSTFEYDAWHDGQPIRNITQMHTKLKNTSLRTSNYSETNRAVYILPFSDLYQLQNFNLPICDKGRTLQPTLVPSISPSMTRATTTTPTSFGPTPSSSGTDEPTGGDGTKPPTPAPTPAISCDGENKVQCKQLKECCVFGEKKIVGKCEPKKSKYKKNCGQFDAEDTCLNESEGNCMWDGKCTHRCDGLAKKDCKKVKNPEDNNLKMCKAKMLPNPCKGCQSKTTCG
jgi:hypothetical protein